MYTPQGQENRDVLVERYAPLVKRIAYHMIGRLPPSVMVDDLIQAGMIGLLDASYQYDPKQGASFETYASIRIRGSMLDELRRNDWVPKSVHRRSRELSKAVHSVEMATGRDATDQEVADEMGIDLDEYYRILQETNATSMMNIEDLGDGDSNVMERIPGNSETPHEKLQKVEFRQRLADEVAKLPEREQLVMALYYDREVNLKEIGAILNVTESRISQLLSHAHARLRSRLAEEA